KVCVTSYVCAAQTREEVGPLQTVCFLADISLKNVCKSSSWCRREPTSSHIFKPLTAYSPIFSPSTELLHRPARRHRPAHRCRPTLPPSPSPPYSTAVAELLHAFDRRTPPPSQTYSSVSSTAVQSRVPSFVIRRQATTDREFLRSRLQDWGSEWERVLKRLKNKPSFSLFLQRFGPPLLQKRFADVVYRRGPQTADVLPLKKQTPPKLLMWFNTEQVQRCHPVRVLEG
ncbi:hypothetical protein R6Q57_003820, partial [Mikania cordata]